MQKFATLQYVKFVEIKDFLNKLCFTITVCCQGYNADLLAGKSEENLKLFSLSFVFLVQSIISNFIFPSDNFLTNDDFEAKNS